MFATHLWHDAGDWSAGQVDRWRRTGDRRSSSAEEGASTPFCRAAARGGSRARGATSPSFTGGLPWRQLPQWLLAVHEHVFPAVVPSINVVACGINYDDVTV